jgi:hypothetical protein
MEPKLTYTPVRSTGRQLCTICREFAGECLQPVHDAHDQERSERIREQAEAIVLAAKRSPSPPRPLPNAVVRDIGITKEASAKDIMHAKGVSKSQATKYLRIIVGRTAGTGSTLRAPIGEVERFFAAGCPAKWTRGTWRAGR